MRNEGEQKSPRILIILGADPAKITEGLGIIVVEQLDQRGNAGRELPREHLQFSVQGDSGVLDLDPRHHGGRVHELFGDQVPLVHPGVGKNSLHKDIIK